MTSVESGTTSSQVGKKKKGGLNRGQFPDQQFCGCSYRKRTLKAYILTFPTAIPTDSKRCYLVILLCKSQRQWHQNVVYIMNIYEYILYHLYLSLFFVIRQNGIVYSFISCLCNNKQFGEKAYNFFCTCDNHGFAGYLFHGCLSDGLFFFFLISILSNLHQVTFMVYIDSMHWLLFPFISYRHLI